jgi:hypothetical protein
MKKLYVQVFVYRPLWEDFEAAIKALPEDQRPRSAEEAVHSLLGSWVQGRRDAVRKATSMIEVPTGDLWKQLTVEERERRGHESQTS